MRQTDLHPLPEKKNGQESLLPIVTTGLTSNGLPLFLFLVNYQCVGIIQINGRAS